MNAQLSEKEVLHVHTLKLNKVNIRSYFEFPDLHRLKFQLQSVLTQFFLLPSPFHNTIKFYLNIVVEVVKSQRIEVASLQDLTVLREEINYLS